MMSWDHVYLDRRVATHPRVRDLLARLQPSVVTEIDDGAAMFNRPGQSFAVQKRNPHLIIAPKEGRRVYPGSARVQSFGALQPVAYIDPVRNCLYDCDYCFLQGMHATANILYHPDQEEYLAEIDSILARDGSLYLSISYLSDLLGFERSLGLVEWWIEAARTRRGLEIEVRTKSDGYGALRGIEPTDRVIFTWSLSPDAIARREESGTAAFAQRILDARRAVERGWRVRLCYDPVVIVPGWETIYAEAISETFRRVPAAGIEAVSFGVFRMYPEFLERIRAEREASVLTDGIVEGDEVASYDTRTRSLVSETLTRELLRYLPQERIHQVHG